VLRHFGEAAPTWIACLAVELDGEFYLHLTKPGTIAKSKKGKDQHKRIQLKHHNKAVIFNKNQLYRANKYLIKRLQFSELSF